MDIKKMIIAIGFAMMAVFAWQIMVQYLAQRNHWTMPGQEQHQTQPQVAKAPSTPPATLPSHALAAAPTKAPTASPATPSITSSSQPVAPVIAAAFHVAPAATTQPTQVLVGSEVRDDPTYSVGITLMPEGASIKRVKLTPFSESVESKSAYTYEQPLKADSPRSRALGTDSVTIDGQEVELGSVDWRIVSRSPSKAVFAVTIEDAKNKPVARVEKTYQVFPKDNPKTLGYESHISQKIINLSDRPLKIQTSVNGAVAPVREIEEADERQIIAGYPSDNEITPGYWMLNDFVKEKSTKNILFNDKKKPMRWAGTSSVYFLAIVRPEPAPKGMESMPLASVTASALNKDEKEQPRQVATLFTTGDVTLAPGKIAELPLSVYFGPKKRSVIANAYYSAPPLGYDAAFRTMSHGFCGFCAFQPLINILVDMLRGFHFIFRDWGLAIIALVVVVRLLLHPITRKSTISMQKMQTMGPEMEKLKAKYKDNQEELNKAMVQFYKEQGVTPILGCLPMLLQTPIWIALWEALQNTFELRQAPFLHPFGIPLTWISDLAKPDAIYTFAHPIPLFIFGWHLQSINLLPILMGVAMYLQQKFTPRPTSMTAEQSQQQKMMVIMSTLLFPLMLYTGPSGLNLYIFTSSAVGIWESKIIRDHILRKEAAEKEGKVFVETTRKMKKGGGGAVVAVKEPPKSGIAGWFAKMQDLAEQQRKTQQKKKK